MQDSKHATHDTGLADQPGPYLRQRARDKVMWWPWGEAAFEAAQDANKPILLSIGYSACPWCAKMADESFRDSDVAAAVNQNYVAIVVDREQRPDLNAQYQSAAQGLGLAGGWPLTLFCTPDGLPFWGGTFFPARDQDGQSGFLTVLNHIAEGYRARLDDVRNNAASIKDHMAQFQTRLQPGTLNPQLADKVAVSYMARMDLQHGGITGAPKFPNVPYFERLWRAYLRTGRADFAAAIQLTFSRMCQGGFYDHIGGGFARYSLDGEWHEPQQEKLLTDNAMLLASMCHIHGNIPQALYAQRIAHTTDFLLHDMRTQEGAFCASIGTTEGFYRWQKSDVMTALGETLGQRFCQIYAVEEDDIPSRHGYADFGDAAAEAPLLAACEKLRQIRAMRPAPPRDDQVLADANGFAISAIATAAKLMQRSDWFQQAKQAYGAVLNANRRDGLLYHSSPSATTNAISTVDDYASLGLAGIALACAEDNPEMLDFVRTMADDMLSRFQSSSGIFMQSADDPVSPFAAGPLVYDQPLPSGNALAAGFLSQLSQLLGAPRYRDAALQAITALGSSLNAEFMGMSALLNAYEDLIDPIEVHWAPADFDAQTIAWAAAPVGALIVGPRLRSAFMTDICNEMTGGGILICRDESCGMVERTRSGAINALRNARRIAVQEGGETLS